MSERFAATYKFDDKGKCHDDTRKFAKPSLCAAVAHTLTVGEAGTTSFLLPANMPGQLSETL